MNIVKVTVRPFSTDSYVWSTYYDEIPTLTKLIEDVKAIGKTRLMLALLDILEIAKPGRVSTNARENYWSNTVGVAATPVGVIEYEKIAVAMLKNFEKEKYRGQLEDLADVMAPAKE